MTKETHILVVDDDSQIRHLFSRALRSHGYFVSEAATGMEGLRQVKEKRPDLVILDVVLPDTSGVEVCRLIKADPSLIDVFVVLVSGEALSAVQKVDGLDTGADDYLAKPMVMTEFLARIRASERLQRSNAALRASEQHYRRLVEILPDAVGLIDKKGRIIQVNQQAASMLGYDSAAALGGKKAMELVGRKDRFALRMEIKAMLNGSRPLRNVEFEAIKRDGTGFPVEISATMSTDGIDSAREVVMVARDLTERKKAEEDLEKSRLLLEMTLHSIRSAVFLMDATKSIIKNCNPAATQIFGFSYEEMIGQSPLILHQDAESLDEFNRLWRMEFKQHGSVRDFEFQLKRKDGTIFNTEHSMMPIRDVNGNPMAWVSVVRDITDRKLLEDELRQFPARIIEAQEAERLRVARELHDGVNQLLATAKMRLCKVEESLGNISPVAREMLSRCNKLMVQALEENRRIAHNLRPSELDALGLAAACRNVCELVQSRTNLKIKCDIAPVNMLPEMELNLFRIFQEALTNIEKHAQAKNIHIQLSAHSDLVVLRVQDDGCGFPPAASAVEGIWRGMGQKNMRERAAILGGAFDLASVPGKGTTITVRVPHRNGETGP